MLIRYAAAVFLAASLATPALADCDLEKGEKVYKKCKTCHEVGADAKSKLGPVLNGIIGAEMASVDGFKYSDAILAKKAEGAVWTKEELGAFLEKPKAYMKGTKMSFAGLRKDDDRENVICYLETFK